MNDLRIFIRTLFIFGFLVNSVFGQSDLLVVSSRGLGTTADASKKDALINAMQQAVGSFIDGETIIENDQIIKDSILAVSDGFVESYDVVSGPSKRDDGLFEITIKAKVKKGKVVERLREVRVTGVGVLGKDAAAELTTRIANAEQGEQLLEKHLDGLLEKLLVARLVDKDGKPGEQIRPITKILPDKKIECQWNIEIYFDLKSFYEQVEPQLEKVFQAVATESGGSLTCIGKQKGFTASTKYPTLSFQKWQGVMPEPNANRDEIAVGLSVGRDRLGENERFRTFILDKNLYAAVLNKVIVSADGVKLHLFVLNDDGGIIRRELIELNSTQLMGQQGPMICLASMIRKEGSFAKGGVLFSPRFAGPPYSGIKSTDRNRSWGYGDTMFIPYKVVLDQDDIEKIADVRFQFAK